MCLLTVDISKNIYKYLIPSLTGEEKMIKCWYKCTMYQEGSTQIIDKLVTVQFILSIAKGMCKDNWCKYIFASVYIGKCISYLIFI